MNEEKREEIRKQLGELGFERKLEVGQVLHPGKIQEYDHFMRDYLIDEYLSANYFPETGRIVLVAEQFPRQSSSVYLPKPLDSQVRTFLENKESEIQQDLESKCGLGKIEVRLSASISKWFELTLSGTDPRTLYDQMVETLKKSGDEYIVGFAERIEESTRTARAYL